jgi:hypothetical protein
VTRRTGVSSLVVGSSGSDSKADASGWGRLRRSGHDLEEVAGGEVGEVLLTGLVLPE